MSRDRARYGACAPPTPPRAARQAAPGSRAGRRFMPTRPMNHYPGPGICLRQIGLFRQPMADETEPYADETIFVTGEDSRKLVLARTATNDDGPPRPTIGGSHDQGFFRHRRCRV